VTRVSGFTLVEFIVATLIVLVGTALAVSLVMPASAAFQALPESTDLVQRLRAAVDALRSDLANAGGGPSLGWGSGAPLAWPAVLPCRWTGSALSGTAGGCARGDSITILSMAGSAPQALVAPAIQDQTAPLALSAASACALDRSACKLHAGALLLLVDGTSSWDLVTASAVSTDGRTLTTSRRSSTAYAPGALVGEATARAYFGAVEAGTGTPQLRRADDGGNSYALIDHAVALSFEYFGAAAPPAIVDGPAPASRAATYGPLPPPAGVDNPLDLWPAGENCTFMLQDESHVSRLASLAPEVSGLARLPSALLADGPWCPDAASANRFDADLLRIRLVRVTVRLQAQSPGVRGIAAGWFAHPGLTRDATRLVPDMTVLFDVALRGAGR